MKKLMFVAAAALCGSLFADVTSANIVGYNTKVTEGTRSPLIGLSFVPVSGETFKLGDFKPLDGTMSPDDDVLQAIDPTTLGATALYCYCDKTTADIIAEDNEEEPGAFDDWIGWWDAREGIGEDDAFCNDVPVTPGMGFMGKFEAYSPISFQSAGEAPTVTTSITTDGTRSPIVCNYIPKTITLGQFAPVDGMMSPDDDVLQAIDPTTLGATALYCYCDKTTADIIAEDNEEEPGAFDEWIGWWDAREGIGEDDAFCNDIEIPAGSGFMGKLEAYSPITFQLPSSL